MGSEIHLVKLLSFFLYGIVYLFTLWCKYATFHEVRFFFTNRFSVKRLIAGFLGSFIVSVVIFYARFEEVIYMATHLTTFVQMKSLQIYL
jgi:hypothetical protein